MAGTCLNRNLPEYKELKERTGLPDERLYVFCNGFVNKHGRFPHLDEIPNADSGKALRENLGLNENNATSIEDVLSRTQASSIEEATARLNEIHRDKETRLIAVGDRVIVESEDRPSIFKEKEGFDAKSDQNVNRSALGGIINKLSTLYGVDVNPVTIDDLATRPEFKGVTDAVHTNAFVLDGHIFVNMDVARADAPIHEFGHLLLGHLAVNSPDVFNELVSSVEAWDGYELLASRYPNRTRQDVDEEIFVTEVSKYLSNQPSMIDYLDNNMQYELTYNLTRMLDSILMGDVSAGAIDSQAITSMNLTDLANLVNSDTFRNHFRGSLTDSAIHRTLNNKKMEMIQDRKLKEICE